MTFCPGKINYNSKKETAQAEGGEEIRGGEREEGRRAYLEVYGISISRSTPSIIVARSTPDARRPTQAKQSEESLLTLGGEPTNDGRGWCSVEPFFCLPPLNFQVHV